jgi:cellobiose phosphorylase
VKYDHKPGRENTPDDDSYVRETGHPSYRADDALWLFPTVGRYIAESGNVAFLDEDVSYANNGESGSVYDHLKRAIAFSAANLGGHGMPAGLHADWNDCVRLGKKGESTFVAFQLVYAIKIMLEYARFKNDNVYAAELGKLLGEQLSALAGCWDGDRWIRGYKEDGEVIGRGADPEANMWLNPQSWAVIAGVSSEEQARMSMDSAHRELNTPYGLQVMNPPYHHHAFDGALMVVYNHYTKENAGIFSQCQGWAILAEALLGRGSRAFEYWRESSPAYMNEDADRRVIEPYAHGQFTEGRGSPFAGRSHVHWLTGTASTVMVGSVEGRLGIKPQIDGIIIDPAPSPDWKRFTIRKVFRGKTLNITVENPDSSEYGVKRVEVNGEAIEGVLIREDALVDVNEVRVVM